MSQYYGNTTTNFFKVTDAEAFKAFMQQVKDTELDTVHLWTKENETGTTLFSFGCYASIAGILLQEGSNFDDDDVEYSFDAFITELQKFLPDGEIVVIKESGHEKLRYVGGHVTVITNSCCEHVNLDDVAYYLAKQMTQNENIKISYF